MAKRRLTLPEILERQNNTRGMGLARDVAAGQAKPVPSRAQKEAIDKIVRRRDWAKGRRWA